MEWIQTVDGHSFQINHSRDLARGFGDSLVRWGGPAHLGLAGTGLARAEAGLALLNDALTRLDDRDRSGIKSALTLQRDEIARAIEAIDALVGNRENLIGLTSDSDLLQKRRLTGERYAELVCTCDQAFADRRAADQQMFAAVAADDVKAGRAAIDQAEANQRHANRQISAVADSIVFPALPDAKLFELARTDTDQLLRLSATKPTARQMHAALDAGLNAPPAVAKLWIVYEGEKPHVLVDLRWRAFEEREQMRPVKFNTLAALETAFAEARSAPLKSQIKKRARQLAAAHGLDVPAWAWQTVSSLRGLPEVLRLWRSANTGRAIETDRFGCIVLVEHLRFTRRQAVYSTPEQAAAAVIARAVAWDEPAPMAGMRR